MHEPLAKSWLSLQCRMIPNVVRALVLTDPLADGSFATVEPWPEDAEDTEALQVAARRAMVKGSATVSARDPAPEASAARSAIVACPLPAADARRGAVAIELQVLDPALEPIVVQLLEWGSAWLASGLRRQAAAASPPAVDALRVLAACLEQRRFRAAATAVATALAQAFACGRVSVGVRERRRVRLCALSHSATFERRTNLLRRIEAAMDEACDRGATIVYPAPPESPHWPGAAHLSLARGEGGEAVCTVVLGDDGSVYGALTLERPAERPFDAAQIEQLQALGALLGPILDLKRRREQGIGAKLLEAALGLGSRIAGPGHAAMKLSLGVVLVLGAVLVLGTAEYRVPATATLEGSVQRALVAPMDGYIASAHARAGGVVAEGALLAALEDTDLRLEERRLRSQRAELVEQYHRALGDGDRGAVKVLKAQIGQAEVQLDLVEEQLARTQIRAPFDGVVVQGDLSRSLGTPVERGQVLFEIAPLDDYQVVLQVDEGDVVDIREGSRGHLALAALPGERLALVVEKIKGVAQVDEGRNVFQVEARLEQASGRLRPGMEGVARIGAGRRSLAWIWTHRLVDRIRLWLWYWWP